MDTTQDEPQIAWKLSLFEKQLALMRMCREKNGLRKYILASGARWSGKTIAALHAVVDHAFNTKNASVCVLTITMGSGTASGVWTLLTETILPEWISGGFGLEWARKGEPRTDPSSKRPYCIITNKFGGRSRIELNSLRDERRVEADFKGRLFSMIYVSEASNFKLVKTYMTLLQILRVKGLPEDEYVLLLDTNPADDGEDSWMYREFYTFRTARPETLDPDVVPRQKFLQLIEFLPDDNLFLTEDFRRQKKAEFSSDPDLFQRYWLGKWKRAKMGALFSDVFLPAKHVFGILGDEDPEVLVPEEDCQILFSGWDYGPTNPAVVIAEQFYPFTGPLADKCAFKFISEVATTEGQELSIGEFTEMVVEQMERWEEFLGRPVEWRHFSDRQAFDVREPIALRYQYEAVYASSAGRIELESVARGPGSVSARIRLWRKMLHQDRLIFSAAECPKLIEANQSLPCGAKSYSIAKASPFKHPWDASSYLVSALCLDELHGEISMMRTAKQSELRLVSVPL